MDRVKCCTAAAHEIAFKLLMVQRAYENEGQKLEWKDLVEWCDAALKLYHQEYNEQRRGSRQNGGRINGLPEGVRQQTLRNDTP